MADMACFLLILASIDGMCSLTDFFAFLKTRSEYLNV